uniref:Uncharacterized protein n=1 Tax=Rhizophora mucronata TaxID=61149 RepID=A0A2P2QZS9_RHIMU
MAYSSKRTCCELSFQFSFNLILIIYTKTIYVTQNQGDAIVSSTSISSCSSTRHEEGGKEETAEEKEVESEQEAEGEEAPAISTSRSTNAPNITP